MGLVAHLCSQAAIPSQAGTSCQAGASTARSRDGQPSPSGNSGQTGDARAESTPVSRRSQHPDKPPRSPVGHPPSRPEPSRWKQPSSQQETLEPAPTSTFAESKASPAISTATRTWPPSHPPAPIPRQTPLSGSHLVSAHPPCSRKGPLLPACSLKRPWRVKREATNSLFVGPGTLPNFTLEHPPSTIVVSTVSDRFRAPNPTFVLDQ